MAGAIAFSLVVAAVVMFKDKLLPKSGLTELPHEMLPVEDHRIAEPIYRADQVARAFLNEGKPERRLQWVRNRKQVAMRMHEYSADAREMRGDIDKLIGHGLMSGRQVTAYAVVLTSGEVRLMELVETDEGPRVDWDAYARYGTASWDDLWSGAAQRAIVRVYCQLGLEHPKPLRTSRSGPVLKSADPICRRSRSAL